MQFLESEHEKPWLEHYAPGMPQSLEFTEHALSTYLDDAADRFPRRRALIFQNFSMNYKKLRETAEKVAANLRRMGVQPNDRVALIMPNLPQTCIAFWGVLKAGAVVVMTNPLYTERELAQQLMDSGAQCVIAVDLVWHKLQPLLEKIKIPHCIITRIPDGLAFPLNLIYTLKAKHDKSWISVDFSATVHPWKELLSGNESLSHEIDDPKKALALLQYTGGTTGVPKGVMLSHYNLCCNTEQLKAVVHEPPEIHNTFLAVLPFFHVYGLTTSLFLPVSLAATVLPVPRYVPRDLLMMIKKHSPTAFPGAPSVYVSLMQQKDIDKHDLSCIRFCVSGSAPMLPEHMIRFQKMTGARMIEGYGLTEASPVTHANPPGGNMKFGSIGLPLPNTDARIVDMELGYPPLPVGKIGELVVKGPQVMQGYWKREDETANVLRNGWLYTGDIAYMDEEGYFFIADRKKDMILVGGYNVYPREIDEVLLEHPDIFEAVSIGVYHPTRGEIIKAFIVPREGATLTKADVVSFCRARLAVYKIPRQVEFRTELPKNFMGKILRRVLRNEEDMHTKETPSPPAQPGQSSAPDTGEHKP